MLTLATLTLLLQLPPIVVPLPPSETVQGDPTAPCRAGAGTLCLLGDRVAVEVRYRNQRRDGAEGAGHAVPWSDNTGFFWFFAERNLELMVKALDGVQVNGALWIFVGSLSDVEYWVEVLDTQSGLRKTYYNPPGNTYGLADTNAFPSDGSGARCGGDAPACTGDLFCDPLPDRCGDADPPGVCVVPGDTCPLLYDPVCGCDGTTYGNDCERIRARVGKEHDGECGSGGQFCGGIAGIPCPSDDLVCDLDPDSCDVADVGGTCKPRPEVCPDLYDPVCGCNGETYSNDCFRLIAGVPRDHVGACSDRPPP